MKSSVTILFTPVIIKYMEKYPDMMKPLYREQIFPVPGHFIIVIEIPLYIGMQGKIGCGLVPNRVEKSEDFCLQYSIIKKNWSLLTRISRIPVNLVNVG